MPIYEYECKKCKDVVEVFLRSAKEKPVCPDCGSPQLAKQLSVAAAPNTKGASLPTAEPPTCGRPQCQSGCMFE